MLKIALDFDGTYTADPELWAEFVRNCKKRHIEVKFITYRYWSDDNRDIEEACALLDLKVIYTNGKQKRNMWNPDIWIDDMPEMIPIELDVFRKL